MKVKFAILVALQIAILLGIVGYREYWSMTGNKVLLEVKPVSISWKEYAPMRFNISEFDLDKVRTDGPFTQKNDTGIDVYVTLEKNENGEFAATGVYRSKPKSGTFIRGKVTYIAGNMFVTEKEKTIRLEYGVENYFAEEGEKDLESLRRKKANKIEARLAINRKGIAMVTDIFVNGKKI